MKYIADDYKKGLSIKKLMDKYNVGNTNIMSNLIVNILNIKRGSTTIIPLP